MMIPFFYCSAALGMASINRWALPWKIASIRSRPNSRASQASLMARNAS